MQGLKQELVMLHMCMHGAVKTWRVALGVKDKQSIFLTEEERQALAIARNHLCHGYRWLWTNARTKGKPRFPVKPKALVIDKMLRRAMRSGVCPSCWWSFSLEDWIGSGARLAGMVHGSSINSKALERWLVAFFSESAEHDA